LTPGSGHRPAPHRERLRDRPCDASATCLPGKVPNPDGCRARRKESELPATALHCRICETEHALEAVGTCPRCFGPLDPVYDWDEVERAFTREALADGPLSIWRYAPLLPVAAPAEPRLAPGLTPLVPAPRLADALGLGELWLKLDTANPTHSFKDRVVAVAAGKAQELGLETLACSSTGNLGNAVPGSAGAAARGAGA